MTTATLPPEREVREGAEPSGVPRWLRHATRVVLHFLLDAAAVAVAYRLAYELRFHSAAFAAVFPVRGDDPGWHLYSRLMWAIVPMWIALFGYDSKLYSARHRPAADRFLMIVRSAMLGTLATMAATFVYSRLAYSRLMLLTAGPIAAALVTVAQALVLRIDRWIARHEATSPLLLVGGGKAAELIRLNLLERHPGMAIHTLPELGRAEEALEAARKYGSREIVLTRSQRNAEALALAELCESADIDFKMVPDLLELRLGELQMDDSLGLLAYRLQHTSLTRANYAAKRAFDLVFSLLVFAVAGLPLALIGLLIKLDSKGPVLYRQKRLGHKGQVFEAFKFRTMHVDAEKRLKEVKVDQGGFFKLKDDPRITSFGKLLRRFSLDEFPHFLPVRRGEMSVVGPRPLAVNTGEMEELMREFGPTAKKRMNMLPGITGLWQVSGRSDVDSQQRFGLDMFYIERWSLGLDLEIILKTVPAMLFGKGAY
ncbi:MAG: sugar transferase [Elusimicrobia bacterium]|nr:sugar transferase [Elusimicrobiota bacterium]